MSGFKQIASYPASCLSVVGVQLWGGRVDSGRMVGFGGSLLNLSCTELSRAQFL